ncbi:MAG: T9SS type A sorting domain-containing protein [Arcticibacter sp.]
MKNKLLIATAVACFYFATASFAQTVPSYVPTNGLVGWWPFNGNANDESGNGNNGTVNGATLTNDRNAIANSAYSFDGINDKITSSLINPLQADWSISFWFKSLNGTSNFQGQNVVGLGSDMYGWGGSGFQISGQNPPGQCPNFNYLNQMYFIDASQECGGNFLGGGLYTYNTWYNIVIIKNNLNYNLIVNNMLITSSLLLDINIDQLIFGNRDISFQYFNGIIDDIGAWNRALTQQEITQLYTSGCTKPEPVSLGTNASTRLCPSESVTIEIVTPADSANYTYQWTRNGTNMVGATTRSITVNDAAKYKVFVSSGPGVDCRRVSGLVETTPSIPPSVVATAPNGTSYCPGDSVLMTATGATAGYSYRWKRFGVVIPGANSNTFYATQTGNYRCEIYNAGGCITQSNLISITNGTSCRIMEQTNSDVSLYPNPAQNGFTVSFNDIGNETPVSVSLRSLQGQVIEQRNIAGKEDVQFAVNKLSPGLYVVIIQLESGDSIEKTVVVE